MPRLRLKERQRLRVRLSELWRSLGLSAYCVIASLSLLGLIRSLHQSVDVSWSLSMGVLFMDDLNKLPRGFQFP